MMSSSSSSQNPPVFLVFTPFQWIDRAASSSTPSFLPTPARVVSPLTFPSLPPIPPLPTLIPVSTTVESSSHPTSPITNPKTIPRPWIRPKRPRPKGTIFKFIHSNPKFLHECLTQRLKGIIRDIQEQRLHPPSLLPDAEKHTDLVTYLRQGIEYYEKPNLPTVQGIMRVKVQPVASLLSLLVKALSTTPDQVQLTPIKDPDEWLWDPFPNEMTDNTIYMYRGKAQLRPKKEGTPEEEGRQQLDTVEVYLQRRRRLDQAKETFRALLYKQQSRETEELKTLTFIEDILIHANDYLNDSVKRFQQEGCDKLFKKFMILCKEHDLELWEVYRSVLLEMPMEVE